MLNWISRKMGQPKVLKYLFEKGLSSSRQIADGLRLSQNTVMGSIKSLISQGLVEKIIIPAKGNECRFFYRLVVREEE